MASSDERTQDWVLELHSLDSLADPGRPATLHGGDDSAFPRWSTELTPGDGEPQSPASGPRPPTPSPSPLPGAAECLDFVKARGFGGCGRERGSRFRPARQTRLRNNLLAAVGFLEFANAGDFAANVWNETPVPTYALALMIVGGITALSMIYFSVRDGLLSLANVRALRTERAYLLRQRAALLSGDGEAGTGADANMVRTLDCFLDMNTRELGTELVDRVGMDMLLGFSSLVVGIGTLMATTGDHDSAEFEASNLLTGYIGNMPCAIYGVANLLWSSYVWVRARKQQRAALNYVRASTRISQMLRNRTSSLQMHAALNGVGGVVAGAAALVTATMWWGYVVLVPCVVTSGLVNMFWRRCVGYERPLVVREITSIDQDAVLEALRYASTCRERIQRGELTEGRDAFSVLVADTASLPNALEVIRKNSLMEDFCFRLLHDVGVLERLRSTYPPGPDGVPMVDWDQLLATENEAWVSILRSVAKETINGSALQSFIYQERHLLEVLGCYMCRGAEFGRRGKGKKPAGWNHVQPQRNVHTYAGRHANDWLFGGFSLTETMRAMFKR